MVRSADPPTPPPTATPRRHPTQDRPDTRENNPTHTIPSPRAAGGVDARASCHRQRQGAFAFPRWLPCPCPSPCRVLPIAIAFAGAPLSLCAFQVRHPRPPPVPVSPFLALLGQTATRPSAHCRPAALEAGAPSGVRRPRPSRCFPPSATDLTAAAILFVSSRPRPFFLPSFLTCAPLISAPAPARLLVTLALPRPPRVALLLSRSWAPIRSPATLKATARGQAMGIEVEAKQDARCSIKKTLRCSIRTGWRCASEHWAVFSLVLLLCLLYKYTPGFFAFLLSNSPVIICTSLLLAVLLSHGSARLPENREDRKAPDHISAGSSSRDVGTEEQQRFSVPALKKNISADASFGRRDCDKHADLGENVPLLKQVRQGDGRLENFHTSVPWLKQETATEEYMKYNAEKESKGVFSSKDEHANSFNGMHRNTVDRQEATLGLCSSSENVSEDLKVLGKAGHQRTVSADAQSGEVADGTPSKCKWGRAFSVRRRKKLADIKVEAISPVVGNQLDHSLSSPFDTFGSHGNSSSGFDPDNVERHYPDVSMTDTAPALDEAKTGPPLGVDFSCPDPITTDDSDNHLNTSSLDSQPQSVNNEVADNSKAKDDGEEKKDAGTEPALLWTADSEKNVMDLGYSEIERNRRLETLMVKRKSRKNIQFELDGISVSARRMNSFADDAEAPGSAPPILHPRDNDPFDFLTDEQSDDSGLPAPHNLEPQEPMPAPHQDTVLRRHESFSFGRPPQNQRHGPSRFKPSVAVEESSLDEASSSSFQRQFSDRSVSRLSVVSECDTLSSAGDQDHNDLIRSYIRGVRESSPSLADGDGDAVRAAGNECSDGIGFVDNETLNAVIC